MNIQEINQHTPLLSVSPSALLGWLENNCAVNIPERIETTDDLKVAGEAISQLTGFYSYVMSVYLYSKLAVREAKKNNLSKDEINNCIDRRDILKDFAEVLKLKYTAISRMITVKKQVDEELKMLNLN